MFTFFPVDSCISEQEGQHIWIHWAREQVKKKKISHWLGVQCNNCFQIMLCITICFNSASIRNCFTKSLRRSKQNSLFPCVYFHCMIFQSYPDTQSWFSNFPSELKGIVSVYMLIFLPEWTEWSYNLYCCFLKVPLGKPKMITLSPRKGSAFRWL